MRRFAGVLFVSAASLVALGSIVSAQSVPNTTDAALPAILANDNRVAAGHLESGVLALHLEVREGHWCANAADGAPPASAAAPAGEAPFTAATYAFAEEGHAPQTPGPLVRVPQGTEVHVSVRNRLPVAVTVHGLEQHPAKGSNLLKLAPGETREASFTAGAPGSYLYWAATETIPGPVDNDIETRPTSDGAMSGAFIVDPPGTPADDRVFVIELWAKDLYTPQFHGMLAINGKSWPYTERLQAQVGRTEHWRILNATPIPHPMHLHGFYFTVDAEGDGASVRQLPAAERRMEVTEPVRPGHTFDMSWTPERAGNWLFHCHILDHMTTYASPYLFGPDGAPKMEQSHIEGGTSAMGHGSDMGMAKLVLGISVAGDAHVKPASATVLQVGAERHLFIRERPAQPYVPAGAGFYLEDVSRQVDTVGPPLVITRGVRTAVTITNELKDPTVIHWHGLEIESYYDGVAGWAGSARRSTPPIAPGTSFIAYMTPPRAGTFIYHTHWHDVNQLTGGLYGALLVLEPGQKYDPVSDKVFVLGRSGPNDLQDPMVLNGSPQPSVMVLLAGRSYRFRMINMTPNDTLVDMSLTSEGKPVNWRPLAKDGADLPPQQATARKAQQPISVGETCDFEFAPAPGEYRLQFASDSGNVVTQTILVVPQDHPLSVFAKR